MTEEENMKAIKAIDDTVIPLFTVTEVHIFPEECTGDGECDTQCMWHVAVKTLYNDCGTTVFEAEGFDNKNKWFYGYPAVKGKNYEAAYNRYEEIKRAVNEEKNKIVYL